MRSGLFSHYLRMGFLDWRRARREVGNFRRYLVEGTRATTVRAGDLDKVLALWVHGALVCRSRLTLFVEREPFREGMLAEIRAKGGCGETLEEIVKCGCKYAGKSENIEAFREWGDLVRVEAWYKPDGLPWMLGSFARPDVGRRGLDVMSRHLAGEYRADNDVATGIVRFSWGTHEVQPGRSLSGCCMEFEGEFREPETPRQKIPVSP